MKIPILGVDTDARIVGLVRGIVLAAILAALVAAQKVLADPSVESYGWVPIAALVIRMIEGALDHSDDTRPG
jgi:hypothetical protein